MSIRTRIFGAGADDPLLPVKRPKGAQPDTLFSVKVARQTRRASNDRSEDRHRLVNEHARLTYNGAEIEVELINLSGGGAMVSGDFEPMIWDRVDLHLGNHGTIECAVRWIRDGRVGLEFAHETQINWPSDQVATVLRHVIERTFPHIEFNRPAEPATPVTKEEPEVKAEDKDEDSSMPEDVPAEYRSMPRHPLIWKGTLHHDFQSSEVRIRNISETGAMIQVDAPVRVGSEPLLEISPALSVSATVEWAVGDQVGMRFHSPFELSMLAESRPVVAVASDWTPPEYVKQTDGWNERWRGLSIEQLCEELEGFLKR